MWRKRVRRFLHRFGYDVRYEPLLRFDDTGIDKLADIARLVTTAEPVFLDVGANVGQTITALRTRFPLSTIHAFEPSPTTFSELARNCSGMPRLQLNCFAVGGRHSSVQFSEYEDSQYSSILAPGLKAMTKVVAAREVELRTVDDYCRQHGIEHLDLLKSDTQGYELEVLTGADGMLRRGKVTLVLVELIFSDDYLQQASYFDVLRYLHERRFRIVAFYDFFFASRRLNSCNVLLARQA